MCFRVFSFSACSVSKYNYRLVHLLSKLLIFSFPHADAFLSAKELSNCKDQVRALYQRFVNEKKKAVGALLACTHVTMQMRPDFEKLEKKKVFETEPLPGMAHNIIVCFCDREL